MASPEFQICGENAKQVITITSIINTTCSAIGFGFPNILVSFKFRNFVLMH